MLAVKLLLKLTPKQSATLRRLIWEQRTAWNMLIVPTHAASRFAWLEGRKFNGLSWLAKKDEDGASPYKRWLDTPLASVHTEAKAKASMHRLLYRANESSQSALKSIKTTGLKGEEAAERASLNPKRYRAIREASIEFQGAGKLADVIDHTTVKIPGLGACRFRDKGTLLRRVLAENPDCRLAELHVQRDHDQYNVALIVDHALAETPAPKGTSVGVDPGVATPWMTSDGEAFGLDLKAKLAKLQRAKEKLDQKLSRQGLTAMERSELGGLPKNSPRRSELLRKQASSKRRKVTVKRSRRVHRRMVALRRQYHNTLARDLTSRYETIALEDTQVANMTGSAAGTVEAPGKNVAAKSGLNREILNLGWTDFALVLEHQAAKRGGKVVRTRAAYSSRRCPMCGHEHADNRPSQAEFVCQNCGFAGHADIVAAYNHKVGVLDPEASQGAMRVVPRREPVAVAMLPRTKQLPTGDKRLAWVRATRHRVEAATCQRLKPIALQRHPAAAEG